MSTPTFQYVSHRWDDATAAALQGVDRLVYRSNCLGADQRITNTGGGNTSSKLRERDPLTGEEVEVLWVKGSGGDLRKVFGQAGCGAAVVGAIAARARAISSSLRLYTSGAAMRIELSVPETMPMKKV